jgi:hypothetical protein
MAADHTDETESKGDTRPNHIPLPLRAAWIIVPGVLILFAASPISTEFGYVVIGMPFIFLVWIATIAWSAHHFIRVARWRRSLKRTNKLAVVPAAAILAIVAFLPFLHACNYLGGALRFAMTRSNYDHQVALLPADDKPRIAVFNWGGMIWSSQGVVYDESDEIALPLGQQSAAWLDKARETELDCGHWNENRLWYHYYLVSFSC